MFLSSRTINRMMRLHTKETVANPALAQAPNQTLIPRVIHTSPAPASGPASPTPPASSSRPASPAGPAAPATVQTTNFKEEAQNLFTAMSTHIFAGVNGKPDRGRHTFSSYTAKNKAAGRCDSHTRTCIFQFVSPPDYIPPSKPTPVPPAARQGENSKISIRRQRV